MVDADSLQGDYGPSQTPWSQAELLWARGTTDAVFAARSDFAKAFIFADTPSPIPYAHREWVMLPEGEMITVDRVATKDAAHDMYVNFHADGTAGTFKFCRQRRDRHRRARAQLAIHGVLLSGGKPGITQPPLDMCTVTCNDACGACFSARFPVDEYSVAVPGPWAVAVHVIDGLASGEAQATVGSMNDDTVDPPPKQNAGVLGAAVYRGSKQSYVVASSAMAGAAGATMTYGVPGGSPSRHVVFDAPEDGSGKSLVTAAVAGRYAVRDHHHRGRRLQGSRCSSRSRARADGCKATESTDASGTLPPGTGAGGARAPRAGRARARAPEARAKVARARAGASSGSGGGHSGCSCKVAGRDEWQPGGLRDAGSGSRPPQAAALVSSRSPEHSDGAGWWRAFAPP